LLLRSTLLLLLTFNRPATKRTIFKPSIFTASTIPSTAVQRPMAASKKNEIFVDIFEKLTVTNHYHPLFV
jgi:hypothetical protein